MPDFGTVSVRGTPAADTFRVLHSTKYKLGSRKPVFWLAGLNGTADTFATVGTDTLTIAQYITDAGFPLFSCDVQATWGNSVIRTRIDALKTWAQTTTGIAASGKVHFFTVSHGGVCGLNYAKYNPTLVQSVFSALPPVDIQDIYINNRGGFQASINTAYGGAPADADNPADNTVTLDPIPQKLVYASDDPICVSSPVTTYGSAVGAETTNLGAVGHTLTGFNPLEAARFFSQND